NNCSQLLKCSLRTCKLSLNHSKIYQNNKTSFLFPYSCIFLNLVLNNYILLRMYSMGIRMLSFHRRKNPSDYQNSYNRLQMYWMGIHILSFHRHKSPSDYQNSYNRLQMYWMGIHILSFHRHKCPSDYQNKYNHLQMYWMGIRTLSLA
ncbi:hypothetical protein HDV02_006407, partial [Globomyces sp. JEL0801]